MLMVLDFILIIVGIVLAALIIGIISIALAFIGCITYIIIKTMIQACRKTVNEKEKENKNGL